MPRGHEAYAGSAAKKRQQAFFSAMERYCKLGKSGRIGKFETGGKSWGPVMWLQLNELRTSSRVTPVWEEAFNREESLEAWEVRASRVSVCKR